MNAPAKLAAFAATLAVLLGGGALAGGAIDPDREKPRAEEHKTVTTASDTHTEDKAEGHGGAEKASHPVRGLAVAESAAAPRSCASASSTIAARPFATSTSNMRSACT
jgi:hypothetical protein